MSLGPTHKPGQTTLSEINVTPLVDVMLVLLIIFMVTAPMLQQGVDVNLPQEGGGNLDPSRERLVITVAKNERIFLNDRRIDFPELEQTLRQASGATREVFLRADKDIPYGLVVKMMAVIKQAGIERLGIVTVPADDDGTRPPS
ncbi:MAG: ExbD/TolR family protein [Candidatus Tectomicrobia bacterium]|jgi:biopolymer transport protein TolR|nr:ExbD/TolR family protein [Candidatus Tectomicrobia bacterium]HEX2276730.1 ExbD/TolR family protein [Candidatus Tectomicrobia bacterium]